MLSQSQWRLCMGPIENGIQARQVFGQMGSVIFCMPQVQNSERKAPIFVMHTMANQSNRQIRIFMPPPLVTFIKAIHRHQVGSPNRHVAGASALPMLGLSAPPAVTWQV